MCTCRVYVSLRQQKTNTWSLRQKKDKWDRRIDQRIQILQSTEWGKGSQASRQKVERAKQWRRTSQQRVKVQRRLRSSFLVSQGWWRCHRAASPTLPMSEDSHRLDPHQKQLRSSMLCITTLKEAPPFLRANLLLDSESRFKPREWELPGYSSAGQRPL